MVNLQQKHFEKTPELYQRLIEAKQVLLREAGRTPFYKCITIEFYDNGLISMYTNILIGECYVHSVLLL